MRKNLGTEEDQVMKWEEEMGKGRGEGRHQEEEEGKEAKKGKKDKKQGSEKGLKRRKVKD